MVLRKRRSAEVEKEMEVVAVVLSFLLRDCKDMDVSDHSVCDGYTAMLFLWPLATV